MKLKQWAKDAWHEFAMRLFYLALSRKPDQVVQNDGSVYLQRWHMIPKNPLLNVFIHQICRSDDERALHDHPWASMSYILMGRYDDVTPQKQRQHPRLDYDPARIITREHRSGDFVFRGARWRHRLVLKTEYYALTGPVDYFDNRAPMQSGVQPVWTLFITGPIVNVWGFFCPTGKVHHDVYGARGCQ